MAGGFVPFGQNLQLQSGVPLAKVGSVFMEKLSATKRLDGGAMGGLLKSVLSDGNLSSAMQNPMAGLLGGLQGQIGGLVGQLQGMASGGPQGLISALTGQGGLTQALGGMQAAGDNLSGLTNGATGFFAMIGHGNTVDMAGAAMPARYGMAAVTGPLDRSDLLVGLQAGLSSMVAQVLSGTLAPAAATTWVQQQVGTVQGITQASADALAWSEANHAMIAAVATVAGALAVPPPIAGGRGETPFQRVLGTLPLPAAHTDLIKHVVKTYNRSLAL